MKAKIGLVVLMVSAWAQEPKSPPLQFEVASVKPAAPGARGMSINPGPGGGVTITNFTLRELLMAAYHTLPFQISGGPSWLDSLHYDIVAKPEQKPTQNELPEMLQSLLADRFQLQLRRETKELPIYALVRCEERRQVGVRNYGIETMYLG